MGLVPASYKVTARSVSRVLGDGRRQSDRSLKGHEAGVRKGQIWAANHHLGIVAVYGPERRPGLGRGANEAAPSAGADMIRPAVASCRRHFRAARGRGFAGHTIRVVAAPREAWRPFFAGLVLER